MRHVRIGSFAIWGPISKEHRRVGPYQHGSTQIQSDSNEMK